VIEFEEIESSTLVDAFSQKLANVDAALNGGNCNAVTS